MQAATAYEAGMTDRYLTTLPEEEKLLAERYLRPCHPKEMICEFTRDAGYLHQYYLLREKTPFAAWGLPARKAEEDETDRQSHILIARRGNQVLAGGRMTISAPRRPLVLPMEQKGLRLAQAFPELGLEHRKYAEISRVVIQDEFQDENSLPSILQHFQRKIVATRVEYLFGLASVGMTKSYQRFAEAAGLEIQLYSQASGKLLEEDGVKMNLIVVPVVLAAMTAAEETAANDDLRETVSVW